MRIAIGVGVTFVVAILGAVGYLETCSQEQSGTTPFSPQSRSVSLSSASCSHCFGDLPPSARSGDALNVCRSGDGPWRDAPEGVRVLSWGGSGADQAGDTKITAVTQVSTADYAYVALRDRNPNTATDNRFSWTVIDIGAAIPPETPAPTETAPPP